MSVSDEHITILSDSMNLICSSLFRYVWTCLAVFLMKLKTGLPNKVLSILFRLKRHHAQRIIHSTRNSFVTEFVPKHLGFEHTKNVYHMKNFAKSTLQHLLKHCSQMISLRLYLCSMLHSQTCIKRSPWGKDSGILRQVTS